MNYLSKLQKNLNDESDKIEETIININENSQYHISQKTYIYNSWLNEKVNEDCVELSSCNKKYTYEKFSKYYSMNSDEITKYESLKLYLLNSKYLIKNDILLKQYIEIYGDKKKEISVFIPPNTKHYHVNYLFKKLVDIVDKYNMYYEVEENKEIITRPLIDINLKEEFYKFCYDNSY
jgi:hypothetical protein